MAPVRVFDTTRHSYTKASTTHRVCPWLGFK